MIQTVSIQSSAPVLNSVSATRHSGNTGKTDISNSSIPVMLAVLNTPAVNNRLLEFTEDDMISETTIRKVRELAIEDVLRPYVSLSRKGSTLMGLCPFHTERIDPLPSLQVRISSTASAVTVAVTPLHL